MEDAELLGAFTAMLTLVAGGLGFYVKTQVSALLRDNADLQKQIIDLFHDIGLVKERQAVIRAQLSDLRFASSESGSRVRYLRPVEEGGL